MNRIALRLLAMPGGQPQARTGPLPARLRRAHAENPCAIVELRAVDSLCGSGRRARDAALGFRDSIRRRSGDVP